jgi:hypothetical protein
VQAGVQQPSINKARIIRLSMVFRLWEQTIMIQPACMQNTIIRDDLARNLVQRRSFKGIAKKGDQQQIRANTISIVPYCVGIHVWLIFVGADLKD